MATTEKLAVCPVVTVRFTGCVVMVGAAETVVNDWVGAGVKATRSAVQFVELPRVNVIPTFPGALSNVSAVAISLRLASTVKPELGRNVSPYLEVAAVKMKSPAWTGTLVVAADADVPDDLVDWSTVQLP